jgi:pimeloyl-ACP methyl ester carboxylesterase
MRKVLIGCAAGLMFLGAGPYLQAYPDLFRADADITGMWEGILDVGRAKLRLLIKIKKTDEGAYSATMDSIDQGVSDIPLTSLELEGKTVRFTHTQLTVEYEGILSDDGNAISGKFSQGGRSFPLDLTRTEKAPEVNRPQEPKKPYPYLEEEAVYENKEAGIKLAGTLTLPKGPGPFPAVILISGSGAQDRNETVFQHKPFLVLSDYLTRRDLAVLRVDDRGVGGSTGSVSDSTSLDFAQDVQTGVNFLKRHKKIDPQRIGLIGHSEGGIIAPIAAAQSQDIAFIVLMAGTGLTGEEILYLQGALISRAEGIGEEDIQKSTQEQRRIFAVVKREKDTDGLKKALRQLYEEDIAKLNEEERKEAELTEEQWQAEIKRITSKWFRFFLTYDPKTALRKVTCPVLALNGELDLQVPPKENLAAIEMALIEAGNKDFTLKELPKLNHLFQTAKTGAVSEYARIEETISPAALEIIGDWIAARTKK